MSKVCALYHIVVSTRERRPVIPLEHCEHLYRFMWKELAEMGCRLLRIGGVENHIHILLDLHPDVALARLVRDLKSHSSAWMRKDGRFPDFEGWGREYYAASVSACFKDRVIDYIKNQRRHHGSTPFESELGWLCGSAELAYDARDLR